MNKYLLGFMVLILSFSSAYVLHLVIPVNVYLQPLKPTDVSPVGPGYTVVLAFDRNTDKGFIWDRIECTTKTDWNITYGKDYKYLYALLKVPTNAEEGDYIFTFTVSDRNGDHVQEDSQVRVHVTRNPQDLVSVLPLEDRVLVAGDNKISFKINNKALGRASYKITYWIEGSAKKYTKTVSIDPGKVADVSLDLPVPSEGFFTVNVVVDSMDTPIVHESLSHTYYARPTLKSKLESIANGFPVVPVPLVPVYTLLSLLVSW